MRMPRIHVDHPIETGKEVLLSGPALHHLSRVLRARTGAEVILFDGSGGEWNAVIDDIRSDHARVRLIKRIAVDRESPLRWELVQGISRGERMDYTLQKAVELGVAAIHPVVTKRTVVKLQGEKSARRREHWEGVARSAAEQSGRTALPAISEIVTLDEFIQSGRDGTMLILDPEANASIGALSIERPERILLLAGPEGGFDETERKAVYRNGAIGVKLGPRILRTETAALVAAALILARWGDY